MGSSRTPTIVRACPWIVAAGLAAPVYGQFAFTQQTRRVFAYASASSPFGPGSSSQQQFVAPDFSPFDATATAGAGGTAGASGHGYSEQISSLLPGVISAGGLIRVASSMGSMSTPGTGRASWDFIVSYAVAEPTWVHVTASFAGWADVLLELKHDTPSGPVLLLGAQSYYQTAPYSFSGPILLEPGNHTATFHAESSLMSLSSAQQQTDLSLVITVVPTPAGPTVWAVLAAIAGRRRRRSRPDSG